MDLDKDELEATKNNYKTIYLSKDIWKWVANARDEDFVFWRMIVREFYDNKIILDYKGE